MRISDWSSDVCSSDLRCVVGVAEHREDRRAADLVDGIVAPLAAGDVAAVEGEQLIQFAPVEENPPRAFAVLTETIELAHASGRAPFASRFRRDRTSTSLNSSH